jgi:hypothetical protein
MSQEQPGAEITVTVYAPSTPDPKQFTWQRSLRVGEAARIAADAFGHSGGNPTFRRENGDVLDRTKPLAAEGVRDGDVLEIVDAGGGV